jgi:hypothetical protein
MNSCVRCGRRLDKHWTECPYCKRENDALTVNYIPDPPEEEDTTPMAETKGPRNPTRVETPVARRETKYQPAPIPDRPSTSPDGSLVKPNPVDNRKIVGVLASYTWRAEGQIFNVREGRTHIGAGNIKEDIAHREVDVRCPDDELMSEDHAMILVQQKKFWIRDLDSTNGTYLNDEQLPPDATVELPNNSEIKVGKTVFTFLKIEPKSEPVTEPRRAEPVKREPVPAPVSDVRNPTVLR